MSETKSGDLREILQDPTRFTALAHFFAEKSSQMHAAAAGDPLFANYLKSGLDLLIDDSVALRPDRVAYRKSLH
jgi:hypothetical protein